MSVVVRFYETGAPEVLRVEDEDLAPPGPGQVQIRHQAIGVNFIDTYFRTGINKVPQLPFVPGNEAAGVVTVVGPGVTEFKEGDRVVYATTTGGAYAEMRNLDTRFLIPLPDSIDNRTAAAACLKGMTAHYLLRQSFRVEVGQTILVHAASGGVGQILCKWAKHLGAKVIGTVGSKKKVALAKAAGCDEVIVYTDQDFAAAVKSYTQGGLCDVVYDGIGQATYPASLDCIKPRGLLCAFGNASGPIRNFDLLLLAQKGSLYVTRPTLATFTATREQLLAMAQEVFSVISSGVVEVPVRQTFALTDAAQAHRALEGRLTTGASLLLP
ncbi:quinone oxidoreductase [Microvirga sp. KLBC 81]|uniref:quinone oxidoreductase family protein n=1 Tax=Microvirga sp. KLBC 81 TaxID=1862707 RepID=UPI000D51A5CC|nr:quinone oxidoreductase [Microvirga sp. KLBC 81]PVE22984.1 quinone oxidoreductase [Microvirga sp. KLBC 81]